MNCIVCTFNKNSCKFADQPKKNTLKSNNVDVRQTVFYAYTCKFGLVL